MNLLALDTALANVARSRQQSTVEVYGPDSPAGTGVIWNPQGLIVTNAQVVPHGPWAAAGLAPGDQVMAINGYDLVAGGQIQDWLLTLHPGQVIQIEGIRQDTPHPRQVTVGSPPEAAA